MGSSCFPTVVYGGAGLPLSGRGGIAVLEQWAAKYRGLPKDGQGFPIVCPACGQTDAAGKHDPAAM